VSATTKGRREFDTAAVERDSHHFGLTTMTERVHALRGELRISSTPEAGTNIEAVPPRVA
jgi:signal transduction histidine kinase